MNQMNVSERIFAQRLAHTLTWYGPSTSQPQNKNPKYSMPAHARNLKTFGKALFNVITNIWKNVHLKF